jgi:trehalose 6-phosphate synthase/phosphatase
MTTDLDNAALLAIASEIEKSGSCIFFLDYDGTLCPFTDDPEEAVLTKEVSDILERITSVPTCTVVIVSGRSADFLTRTFKDLPVSLIAEHGAAVRLYGRSWCRHEATAGWKEEVRPIVEEMVRDNDASWMEEKEFSICWHYRKLEESEGIQRARTLVKKYLQQHSARSMRVFHNNRNVEFKFGSWSKGTACCDVLAGGEYRSIVAIGDDVTDEDMFSSLPSSAITIKVGKGESKARCRVENVSDVLKVLDFLAGCEKVGTV